MAENNYSAQESPFLYQVANTLLAAWSIDGFRNATVYFPSTRAKLFFTRHISTILKAQEHSHPCWMPSWGSIPNLFQEIAGMQIVDPLMIIPHLHRIFLAHYNKSKPNCTDSNDSPFVALDDLNDFYYWGEVLLHDFAQIDLYLCNAQQLFTNINDLKKIDDSFDYLTAEQKKVLQELFDFEERKQDLNRFFNLLKEDGDSQQKIKQQFISIWQILWPVYRDLRQFMEKEKIGYSAHVARRAVERLQADEIDEDTLQRLFPPRIAFAGFNALNRCEQILFDFIEKRYAQRKESALFLWNYSETMLADELDEAGLFMRRHMAHHRIDLSLSPAAPAHLGTWELHAAPSTLSQVTVLANALQKQLDKEGLSATQNSAIVLADENLLLPLLRTLPDAISHCNVTMGYPLRNTLTYSVLKDYLQLLSTHDPNTLSYSRAALIDFLSHPYLTMLDGGSSLLTEASKNQNDRTTATLLNAWHLSAQLLPATGIDDPIAAAQLLLSSIADALNDSTSINAASAEPLQEPSLDADHILSAFSILDTLRVSLNRAEYPHRTDEERGIHPCNAARTLLLLLPKIFRDAKADFFGEPLGDLQIMGFLETRTLDFDTVYILSANDTFLPRVSNTPSFIPRSLQRAFGLPTRSDHEAMYAYYFDTITMRAKRIVLIYTLGSDDQEPSRYILQRMYSLDSPKLQEKKTALPAPNIFANLEISIDKTPEIQAILSQYLVENNINTEKMLSPSSLNAYIDCPLKFYYGRIARIVPPQTDPKDNFEANTFGSCVHAALENLYSPLVNKKLDDASLKQHASQANIKCAVRNAFAQVIHYPPVEPPVNDLPLQWRIYLRSTEQYISNIVKTDLKRLSKVESVSGLEQRVNGEFPFKDSNGVVHHVRIGGYIDRLDKLLDGKGYEVVDYKTGAFNRDFAIYVGDDNLVASTRKDNGYQLQILLYAWLLRQEMKDNTTSISAGLWFPRCRDEAFRVPGLYEDKDTPFQASHYEEILNSLPTLIGETLASLFNVNTPFTQRENDRTCELCDFRRLCNR